MFHVSRSLGPIILKIRRSIYKSWEPILDKIRVLQTFFYIRNLWQPTVLDIHNLFINTYSISTVYTVIIPYLNKRLKNDNVIKPVIYVWQFRWAEFLYCNSQLNKIFVILVSWYLRNSHSMSWCNFILVSWCLRNSHLMSWCNFD